MTIWVFNENRVVKDLLQIVQTNVFFMFSTMLLYSDKSCGRREIGGLEESGRSVVEIIPTSLLTAKKALRSSLYSFKKSGISERERESNSRFSYDSLSSFKRFNFSDSSGVIGSKASIERVVSSGAGTTVPIGRILLTGVWYP